MCAHPDFTGMAYRRIWILDSGQVPTIHHIVALMASTLKPLMLRNKISNESMMEWYIKPFNRVPWRIKKNDINVPNHHDWIDVSHCKKECSISHLVEAVTLCIPLFRSYTTKIFPQRSRYLPQVILHPMYTWLLCKLRGEQAWLFLLLWVFEARTKVALWVLVLLHMHFADHPAYSVWF